MKIDFKDVTPLGYRPLNCSEAQEDRHAVLPLVSQVGSYRQCDNVPFRPPCAQLGGLCRGILVGFTDGIE